MRKEFSSLGPGASLMTSPSKPLRVIVTRHGLALQSAWPWPDPDLSPSPSPRPAPRPSRKAINPPATMAVNQVGRIGNGFMASPVRGESRVTPQEPTYDPIRILPRPTSTVRGCRYSVAIATSRIRGCCWATGANGISGPRMLPVLSRTRRACTAQVPPRRCQRRPRRRPATQRRVRPTAAGRTADCRS